MSGSMESAQSSDTSGKLLGAVITAGLLAIIIGLAAYLRLVGIDWDVNQHLHPDERFLTMVTSSMLPVKSIGEYFDTLNSPLNPNNVGYGFYVYGDLPVILARYVGQAVGSVSYNDVYLVGRALSALADLLVLTLVFIMGKRLFDWRAGLLGAALYGAAALPIQLSHFYTVDTFTNLFVAASFLFIARALGRHSWPDYPLFGVTLGLAVASKVNVAPLAGIFILALWLRIQTERKSIGAEAAEPSLEQGDALKRSLGPSARAIFGLVIAGLATIITFRVAQPYAFLPPNSGVPIAADDSGSLTGIVSAFADPIGMRPNPAWLSQMDQVRLQVSGYSDIPPNHQWGQRLPLIFPWINMVRVGLGWPLGVFCWLAFAWALWEVARRHRASDGLLLLVAWVGLYFTWQGIGWVKTMRYFLPVYPFLALLAGWSLVTLWDRIQALLAARRAALWHPAALFSLGLGAVILLSAYAWGFAVSRIYTRPVTRIAASNWIFDNIPSDISLQITVKDGQRHFEIGLPNNYPPTPANPSTEDQIHPVVPHSRIFPDTPQPVEFKSPVDGLLSSIRVTHVLDPGGGTIDRTLTVGVWGDIYGNTKLATGSITHEFAAGSDPRGSGYDISFPAVQLKQGQTVYIALMPDSSGALDISSSTISTEGEWDDPLPLSLPPYNVWGAQLQGYELQMAWEDIPEKRERMQYILDNADYLVISSNRFYASMTRNPLRFPLTVAYYQALFSGRLGFDLVADFTSRPNLGPIQFYDDNAEEAWTVYDHPRAMVFKKTARYAASNTAAILGAVDLEHTQKVIAKDAQGSPVNIPLPELQATANAASDGMTGPLAASVALSHFYLDFQPVTVIVWWLLISITGWMVFPILFSLMPSLRDRAYPLARAFGLLLTAWIAWMFASLQVAPWGLTAGLVAFLIAAGISIALIWKQRIDFARWVRENRRHLVFVEMLMLILFGFFLLVRLGNPDLWHPSFGGEKPMDMAYFNAVLKSQVFPPYDPWFAGGTINYYYFGFVIVGLPVRMLGIPSTLAYNLILPTMFSLTGAGAFSVAYNTVASRFANHSETVASAVSPPHRPGLWEVLRAWPATSISDILTALNQGGGSADSSRPALQPYLAGLAALLMAVVLGNLDQIRTLLWGLAEVGAGVPQWATTFFPPVADTLRGFEKVVIEGQLLPVGLGEWYWNATRLIPVPINAAGQPTEVGPITEFPYFTFLYADLHAHMIAMPITLLALSWCVALLKGSGPEKEPLNRRRSAITTTFTLLLGALIIGALRPTNTWDWPTYLALGAGAILLSRFYRRGHDRAAIALIFAAVGAAVLGGLTYTFLDSSNPGDPSAASVVIPITLIAAGIGLLVGFGIGLTIIRPRAKNDDHDIVHVWLSFLGGLLQVGVLAGLTVLLFLPFVLTYKLGYTSFIPWEGSKTPVWAYIDVLGLFLFIIVSWMVRETWLWARESRRNGVTIYSSIGTIDTTQDRSPYFDGPPQVVQQQHPFKRAYWLPLAGLIALGVLGILALLSSSYPVSGLAIPLTIWAAILFARPDLPIEKRGVLAMLIFALGLSLIVEGIVLQGDISRMNTVFKFYLQVWILMAIIAGAAFGWLWPSIRRLRDLPRTLWMGGLAVLVFLAALYPLLATRAKVEDRWAVDAPHTLDGMAYMPYAQRFENGKAFSLQPDYDALRWLQDNVSGTPVVLEAHTVEYNWGNRVTVYTGLTAIVGWNWHQRQQRSAQSDEVWARVNDVDMLYNSTDISYTLSQLQRYDVRLIFIGELERAYYDPTGLAKFRAMADMGYLKVIYDRENTVIYQVARTQP